MLAKAPFYKTDYICDTHHSTWINLNVLTIGVIFEFSDRTTKVVKIYRRQTNEVILHPCQSRVSWLTERGFALDIYEIIFHYRYEMRPKARGFECIDLLSMIIGLWNEISVSCTLIQKAFYVDDPSVSRA